MSDKSIVAEADRLMDELKQNAIKVIESCSIDGNGFLLFSAEMFENDPKRYMLRSLCTFNHRLLEDIAGAVEKIMKDYQDEQR